MPYGNRFYQGGLDLNQVLAPVNTMVGWDQAAAQLAETKRRTDLSEAAQQETMRVSQIQHGTGLPGQAGFVPGTEQQKIGLMREELAKKPPIPKFQQVINPSDVVMSKRMTAKQFGEGALKVLEPMFNTINEVAAANPQTTNWDAYQASKSSYAGQKAEMAGRGEKYMMSDEFLKLKPEQQEGFKNLYNQMMTDPDGSVFYDSGVFKQTVESKKTAEENNKAALQEQRQTFQNEMLNQKFENWKEITGIKIQSQKDLQDARYGFMKDLKMTSLAGDLQSKNMAKQLFMQEMKDTGIQIRALNPLQFPDEETYKSERERLESRYNDAANSIKELSGIVPARGAKQPGSMDAMPPAGQHKGKIIRDTATGKRYRSNGNSWAEVK